MDLQNLFYTLGVIVFGLAIIVFVTVLVLSISLYFKYKKFLKESKEKIGKLKRRLIGLPLIPAARFIYKKIKERRRP